MDEGTEFTVHGEGGRISIKASGLEPHEIAAGMRAALVQLYRANTELHGDVPMTEDDFTLTNMAMGEARAAMIEAGQAIESADKARRWYRIGMWVLLGAVALNLGSAAFNWFIR